MSPVRSIPGAGRGERPSPFYASHSLRLGGYIARWVAVRLTPAGTLEPPPLPPGRGGETIQKRGITLVAPTLPLEQRQEELIDFPALVRLTAAHRPPWRLLLPDETRGTGAR